MRIELYISVFIQAICCGIACTKRGKKKPSAYGASRHFQQYLSYIMASVALVEEAIDMPRVTDKLYYIKLYRVYLVWAVFELTTLAVKGKDVKIEYKTKTGTITK